MYSSSLPLKKESTITLFSVMYVLLYIVIKPLSYLTSKYAFKGSTHAISGCYTENSGFNNGNIAFICLRAD